MPEGMEAGACSCDFEPFDFYRETLRKARKRHACCECAREIAPGEIYEHAATVFQGVFEAFKTCLVCSRIRADFCAPFGWLRSTIWELLGTDYVTGRTFDEDSDEDEPDDGPRPTSRTTP